MKKAWISAVVTAIAAFIVGILIGVYGVNRSSPSVSDTKMDISELLLNEMQAGNINESLRILTSRPHLAGTEEDLKQANWIKERLLAVENGFDEVQVVPYEVLLSYPDFNNPNKVYLLDDKGSVKLATSGRQRPLKDPGEAFDTVIPNFNAYSPNGTVEGPLVYAHYGRMEDFKLLLEKGVDIAGKIVLARYGPMSRASIVAYAEERGAKGVVLFSDPIDFAQQGRNNTYPDSKWMPGMAAQNGNVKKARGDPLTPHYPSLESAYRIAEEEAVLPKIPVQSIGYDEAEVLLQSLAASNSAPPEWQGALNTVYAFGPSPAGWKVRLEVRNRNEKRTTYNTIGFIYGEEEPDRYVLLGNHRDAWVLGAIDPSSGTATLLEVARAFATIKKRTGWRPRRTLVFCSWGAEEYGLIGSYEWVEEHAKVLGQRAVAYINVDIAVEGNYSFLAGGVPLLHSVIFEATKKVHNPNPLEIESGRKSVFDTWVNAYPADNETKALPRVRDLGSSSDYAAFIYTAGVPSIDMAYAQKEEYLYPLYHTVYDSFHLMSMVDPGFKCHQAMARISAEIARNLADSPLLPLDIQNYSNKLENLLGALKNLYGTKLATSGASFHFLEKAVGKLSAESKLFSSMIAEHGKHLNALQRRKVNDQLMQLERAFIDSRAMSNFKSFYNHVVLGPKSDKYNSIGGFPGLTELLEAVGNLTEAENPGAWREIKQHLAVLAFHIDAAATSLKDGL